MQTTVTGKTTKASTIPPAISNIESSIPIVRRMWADGPLREFSSTPIARFIPGATGGYIGQYVCEACSEQVVGLYQTVKGWLCCGCKQSIRTKLAEPQALKRARLAKKAGMV